GAASEGEEIEDRDEPVESVHLEDELVEYEPVGTSQSSRNFENIDESSTLVELFVGQRFDSWSLAEHCLKDMDGRMDLSQLTASGDRMAKKRTYACENAGKYKPNKTRPLEHQRFRGSKKTDCKWHVNLSHSEINNSVHITFIDLEYNHVINVDNARFATAFRKFDESIMSEIERTIDLSNAIQKIKREKQVVGSDASHLLKLLLQQQKEDPEFLSDFWKTRNSLCIEVFEHRFRSLLEKYPGASKYLNNPIYSTRESWARSFINQIFTAGMQSTQRVELINTIIHKSVASSSSMSNMVEALELRMQRELLNKSFIEWKHKSINQHQLFIVERLFCNISSTIQKYFTPQIIEEIHKQMCESVLYKYEKLDISHAFEFEDQDSNEYNELNDSQIDNQEETIESIEDYYDIQQTYLKAFINSVSRKSIKEVWRVIPYMIPNSYQHIIILNNGENNGQSFIPRHYHNIQEVQVQNRLQKKMDYGRIMGHFKKALNYLLEDKDQNNLDELILFYIAEKEAMRNTQTQP
ncbi:1209_t:CDS:2, partial [Gigaspora rosea]